MIARRAWWMCLCACVQHEPATALVVSVKTDLTIGTELRQIVYRVFRADADPDVDTPTLELTTAAQDLEHPFVIQRHREQTLLLSVEGFAAQGEEAVIVSRVRARFVEGESLVLPVFLARACLASFCEVDGLTCYGRTYGDTNAGECAIIPGPLPLDAAAHPGDELTWTP